MNASQEERSNLSRTVERIVRHLPGIKSRTPQPPELIAPSAYEFTMREDRNPATPLFILLALLAHLLLFVITFPAADHPARAEKLAGPVMRVKKFTLPPSPPQQTRIIQRRLTRRLPIPDPTPREPEPVIERAIFNPDPDEQIIFESVHLGIPEPPPRIGPMIADGIRVSNPELILSTKIQPRYPELARRVRIEDKVILQVVVSREGNVEQITLLKSAHQNLGFSEAAIEAVQQWRYHPSRFNGRPVDVFITVVVTFELE